MAEYIERESALYEAEKYGCSKGCVSGRHSGIADIIADNILKIPAADVRPERHGEWLVSGDCYECSECGGGSVVNTNPYCWKCGAKMDGKDGKK